MHKMTRQRIYFMAWMLAALCAQAQSAPGGADGSGLAEAAAQRLLDAPKFAKPQAIGRLRPDSGVVGDLIPFYWRGVYHVFYLKGSGWGHIASRDLVHWREFPEALNKGATDAPDGENCWTGSVVEHDGLFHLFYTGKNSRDPKGDQKVMHATSRDLVQWAKQPDDTFYADGAIYWSKPINGAIDDKQIYHHQAFRDPEVVWSAAEKRWWLLLHATLAAGSAPAFARYASADLTHWQPCPPLLVLPKSASGDCPQLFSEGGQWYLIAADRHYTMAPAPEGPYAPEMRTYEAGELFVPKGMVNGDRRILMGWIGDRKGARDAGEGAWGGVMSLPRVLYADSAGRLCQRPAEEVVTAFQGLVLDHPERLGDHERFAVPSDYMLHAKVACADPGARVVFTFRQPKKHPTGGYRLSMDSAGKEIALGDAYRAYKQPWDFTVKPVLDVRVFVLGTVIECFVDDALCFTMRAYDWPKGALSCEGSGGAVVSGVSVRDRFE
jgi:sucrose-6-phosphate hydrolase SacC (GH32 family)